MLSTNDESHEFGDDKKTHTIKRRQAHVYFWYNAKGANQNVFRYKIYITCVKYVVKADMIYTYKLSAYVASAPRPYWNT